MVKIPIEFASGEVKQVKCPVSYFDMRTDLFAKLHTDWNDSEEITPESFIKVFSILTGEKMEDYEASTDSKLLAHISNYTKFVFVDDVDKQSEMPTYFMGVGIQGSNLGRLTLAQNLHARKMLRAKDLRTVISLMIAVYMQPKVDGGSFDFKRVEVIQKEIDEMPITETYALGFFLFRRLDLYGSRPTNYSRLISSTIRSFGKNVLLSVNKQSLNRSPHLRSYP